MNAITSAEQALRSQIAAQEAVLESFPPALGAWRREAMQRFARSGLPTRQNEAWRWLDLTPLYEYLGRDVPAPLVAPGPLDGPFAAIDCWRLTFENGVMQTPPTDLPPGVRVMPLRAALAGDPALVGRMGNDGTSAFLSLNAALLNDGAFIHLDTGVKLHKPLHLIFLNSGNAQIRNLVILEPRAELMLLESHSGTPDTDYFVNQASDVQLGEAARLSHYRDQAEGSDALHFYYLTARLAAHSLYDGFTLTRGACLSRNEAQMVIAGSNAQCHLNGVNMLGDGKTCDTTSVMGHDAPASASTQMFRNVLTGKSQGIFQGLIRVAKPAQRTDARQEIKALLLSPQSVQNSKPELEILADDVKCAHGASSGQLDAAALFYLRARGIAEAEARALLIGAFLDECVSRIQGGAALDAEKIQNPIRTTISTWLTRQLAVDNV